MLNDLKTAFFLASKSIKRGNRGTVFVTVFIMTLAVINLLFMPCILDGMDYQSKSQVVNAKMGHIVLEPKQGNTLIQNADVLQKKINAFPDVQASSVHYSTGVTLYFKDKSTGRSVDFINSLDEKLVTNVDENILEGDYLSKLDTDEILIGSETSGTYNPLDESNSLGGVVAGDKIDVKYNNGIKKTYRVKGIFKTRYPNADYGVFLNKKEMENIFGTQNLANSIIVRLRKENIEYDFIKKLTAMGIGEDIFNSRDRSGIEMTQTFDVIKIIMSAVALLVSVTTLFIVIYIDALNKRKIIAVIKAIGVNKKIIIISFIFQSLFYTLSGIIIGLGILYFILVPHFISNPLVLPFGFVSLMVKTNVVLSRISALVIASIIAGFMPAYHVTKQNIIEAMRS